MREEIKKVLEMLNEKKITNEEATELIEALNKTKKEEQNIPVDKRSLNFPQQGDCSIVCTQLGMLCIRRIL